MTIHFDIYEKTEVALEHIIDWFDNYYGFKPNRSQAISFCIKTMYSSKAKKQKHTHHFNTPETRKATAKVSTDTKERLNYIMNQEDFAGLERSVVLNTIIIQRARSLPQPKTRLRETQALPGEKRKNVLKVKLLGYDLAYEKVMAGNIIRS